MSLRVLAFLIFIPLLVNAQENISASFFANFPILRNQCNTLINNVLHSSVHEKAVYSEKPGISLFASQDIPFLFNTSLSYGIGIDWYNYNLKYSETNLTPSTQYISGHPLIKHYNAINPSFINSLLYITVPLNCKYPLFSDKFYAIGGIAINFLIFNHQEFSYLKLVETNSVTRVENHVEVTDSGINRLLMMFNLGFEYRLNKDFSMLCTYKISLTPVYESSYWFVESSALNVFNLGVSYCFLK